MSVLITVAPDESAGPGIDRAPLARLSRLLDPGSFGPPPVGSGVAVVTGRIAGAPVVAYCTDAARKGGALDATDTAGVVDAIGTARRLRCPVVGLWPSGGVAPAGVESADGVGRMFAAMAAAAGVVPQISLVLGPATGAAAYGPALTDLIVASDGGARAGGAHVVTDDDTEAYASTRRLVALLTNQGEFDAAAVRDETDPSALLPRSPRCAYDVRPLVRAILDGSRFEQLHRTWAPNMVVGLGRLGGRSVGVIANNPIRGGGRLDSRSSDKAARFVTLCDTFGIPLIVLVDVPGQLPGVPREKGDVARRGGPLVRAFAKSLVPRATLITRMSYGGAYVTMNSRPLGATAVFAWPNAEETTMDAVDEVIPPKTTRRRLAETLAATYAHTSSVTLSSNER